MLLHDSIKVYHQPPTLGHKLNSPTPPAACTHASPHHQLPTGWLAYAEFTSSTKYFCYYSVSQSVIVVTTTTTTAVNGAAYSHQPTTELVGRVYLLCKIEVHSCQLLANHECTTIKLRSLQLLLLLRIKSTREDGDCVYMSNVVLCTTPTLTLLPRAAAAAAAVQGIGNYSILNRFTLLFWRQNDTLSIASELMTSFQWFLFLILWVKAFLGCIACCMLQCNGITCDLSEAL